MSVSTKNISLGRVSERPVFRAVFAVSLALLYATTIGYPLAHTTAIFAMLFIGPGKKPIKFLHILVLPAVLYLLGAVGIYIGYVLIDHIFVSLLILALLVFWSFRLTAIPAPVRLLFLIFIVLIPFLSISGNGLGELVIVLLLFNLAIALIIVKLSFLLLPQSQEERLTDLEAGAAQGSVRLDLDKVALNGVLVILPLIIYYYFSNDSDVLTLVFAALLAFDPFVAQSKKGAGLLLANVIGGLIGLLVYQLLVIAPDYSLYVFLCITACFFFIMNIYSGKKLAPVYKTSFNTFFVVMAAVSTSNETAGDEVWSRVLQIGMALIYTVLAYSLINVLNSPVIPEN